MLLLDFESAFFESAFLERVAADLDLVVFGDAFFAADALGVDLAVKPNFVSNSATRVASLSFSSRAFCAIALTVSNSSRETRSIDSTIRSNCCLILLLASSRAVCNDPIAFVATRAKSSNRRLSVCMSFTCYPFSCRRLYSSNLGRFVQSCKDTTVVAAAYRAYNKFGSTGHDQSGL